MSQTTAKPTLVPEGPIVVSQESALGQFVRSVRDRMSELDVSTHGQVLALYGGRGTGKTSALLTLLRLLREGVAQGKLAEADRSKQIEWLLPIRFSSPDEPENSPRQLFAPEYGRVEDDLLFMLLAYLEARYQPLLPDANHRLKERSKGISFLRVKRTPVFPPEICLVDWWGHRSGSQKQQRVSMKRSARCSMHSLPSQRMAPVA
jgi:hypothetical protein